MISVETINTKIQMLPTSSQKKVLGLIGDLLERPAKSNPTEKASVCEDWTKSYLQNTAVLFLDR